MPSYVVEFQNRQLQKLVVEVSFYNPGAITFVFNSNSGFKALEVADAFSGYQSLHGVHIYGDRIYLQDYAQFRQIMLFGFRQGWFVQQDNNALNEIAQFCDAYLAKRNTVVDQLEAGHKNALIGLTDDSVEDILEATSNPNFAIQLFSLAFTQDLNHTKSKVLTLLQNNNSPAETLSSIEFIWRVCLGEANLEDHFNRITEGKLPSLQLQRLTVKDYMIKKFLEKFPNLSDEEQFYCLLPLFMFAIPNKHLSALQDIKKIILDALRTPFLSGESRAAFANSTGDEIMMSLVTQVFSEMKILGGERGPDMQRLTALQAKLQSPHIHEYIGELNKLNRSHAETSSDALWHALKDKNANAVSAAIKQGSNLKQYYVCGRTPLIIAIQNNDLRSVKILVAAGADVNQVNKFGVFNAIGAATNCDSADILRFLLAQPDAKLFALCGAMHFPPGGPIRSVSVFMLAVEKYLREPTLALNKAIMRCVLEAGLGLGFNYNHLFTDVLNDMVIIGSIWNAHPLVHPIATISEFQNEIKSEKFEYWQALLKQAHEHYSHDPALLSQFALLARWLSNQTPAMTPVKMRYQRELKRIETIVEASGNQELNLIVQALQQNAFGKALRQACSTNDPNGFIIAKVILEAKDIFPLDINEKGKLKPLAAIHYAAARQDEALFELLIEHHADPSSTNEEGISASAMMARTSVAPK